ncbi:MAG TPA: hypothetical protein VIM61_06425 [Chthoniobacterales bacterium]|jgi:hypothetical protein
MRALRLILAISTGIARDQGQRRRAISILLAATLVLLGVGIFPLWNFFASHPLFFAIYWLVCAWLTICVLLLAIYDLLMVIRRGREERAAARRRMFSDLD